MIVIELPVIAEWLSGLTCQERVKMSLKQLPLL